MALLTQGLRVHPDWRRQWQDGAASPYPSASPHDIAWRFAREIDRQNPDGTIEDDTIDHGLEPRTGSSDEMRGAGEPEEKARRGFADLQTPDQGTDGSGASPFDQPSHTVARPFEGAPVVGGNDRIRNLQDDAPGRFSLEPFKSEPTNYRGTHFIGRERVKRLDPLIEAEAGRQGVDPDLVRAIIYAENARGWFKDDVLLKEIGEPVGRLPVIGPYLGRKRETILPMNIHRSIWRSLVENEEDLFVPEKNIRAGVTLIKRIADRLDDPSPEKVATLYNQTDRNSVTPWGDLVGRAYAARAWTLPHWTQRTDADADRVPRSKWLEEE